MKHSLHKRDKVWNPKHIPIGTSNSIRDIILLLIEQAHNLLLYFKLLPPKIIPHFIF